MPDDNYWKKVWIESCKPTSIMMYVGLLGITLPNFFGVLDTDFWNGFFIAVLSCGALSFYLELQENKKNL